MLAQEIIRIKRDGGTLQGAQIDAFVCGLVDGSWSEGQAAAMAMAVFLNGLSKDETVALTLAMTHSGEVLDGPAPSCTARCWTNIPPAASATRSA